MNRDSLARSPGYSLWEYNFANILSILYIFLKSKLTAIVLETDAGTGRRFSVTDLTEQYSYLRFKTICGCLKSRHFNIYLC